MRLSGTLSRTISTSRGLGNQLWDLAGNRPSLDLPFADSKSLVDATTGTNLIDFTRASSGTYVGSDGLIKTATTNLWARSEEFQTTWINTALTINAGATQAPTGALSVDSLIPTTASAIHRIQQSISITSGNVYTASVYAKANGYNYLYLNAQSPFAARATFNLVTGAISAIGSGTASIVSVGNGWYRCSVTGTAGSTQTSGPFFQVNNTQAGATDDTFTGDGTSGIYLWGAQLEQSSSVGEYIPTGATINSAPRFDHNPTTGESLGLLVEESRTNSIRNNTMVGAVAGTPGTLPTNWISFGFDGLTRTIVGTGVDKGVNYIDVRLAGTTTNTSGGIGAEPNTQVVAAAAQSWTSSCYLALVGGSLSNVSQILVRLIDRGSAGANLGSSTLDVGPSLTTGWTRPALSRTLSGVGTSFVSTDIQLTYSIGVAIDITLRIGLPQLEQGAFATSVIPTSGTAVTRAADVASISGSNFSSWYRQDEGTMFAQSSRFALGNAAGQYIVCEAGNSAFNNNELIQLGTQFGANNFQMLVNVGNVTQAAMVEPSTTSMAKYVGAYKVNDFAYTKNGATPLTDVSGNTPTVSQLNVGSRPAFGNTGYLNGHVSRLCFWPQRLPNSTLQQITQ